jgi:hypothetical protein
MKNVIIVVLALSLPGICFSQTIANNSTVTFLSSTTDNSWFHLHHTNSNSLQVSHGGSAGTVPIMTLNNATNVGIGTTIPNARLDVNGAGGVIINSDKKIADADLQDMVAVRSETKVASINLMSNRTDEGSLGALMFTTTRGWSDSHRNIAGIVGGRTDTGGAAGGYLGFWTKNNNGDWPRETVRINHQGRVGIGTIAPGAQLHILGTGGSTNAGNSDVMSGDVIVQANVARNGISGAQIVFALPANTDGTSVWGQGRIMTVAANLSSGCACGKMILGTRRYFDKYGSGMQWYYGDDLTIDDSGNVGIGTTSPDSKLSVKGSIHTQEVNVDLTGAMQGPDYVFEKDYNLLPLAELEAYIKINKHLPEVPSAKEMEANGLNLKEMNLLLLKKVEELTLHLIELKKENSEIANLKKRIEDLERNK